MATQLYLYDFYLCTYLSIYLSICLSVYLCPLIYLSIYLSIYPSIYPSIHPSVCLVISVYRPVSLQVLSAMSRTALVLVRIPQPRVMESGSCGLQRFSPV